MGRPAKPIELLRADGNKHLTKSEIEFRRNAEEALRNKRMKVFHPSERVKNNPEAFAMFKRLKKLYKDAAYVDGADEQIINRYCLLTSEIEHMETLLAKMEEKVDECETPKEMVDMYKSITGMTGNIKSARDMLLKMEDRMLLNPTARIKNVPKKAEEKKRSKFDQYGSGNTQTG